MGKVYVVATPIGHLEDITLRALQTLGEADCIYAEDTRRTRVLLTHHNLSADLYSLHVGNEDRRIPVALGQLEAGKSLALVSDAGTPLISDPGARLISAALDAGHRVEPIPGPSALVAALSACGLRVHPFTFLGFLPRRSGPRRRLLEAYLGRGEALVIFEAPGRIFATLTDCVAVFGPHRRACVARELTKLHEEMARATLAELVEEYRHPTRGEITLVVEGEETPMLSPRARLDESEVEQRIAELVEQGRRPREIAGLLGPLSDMPRRVLYARALEVCKARGEDMRGQGDELGLEFEDE